jgi:hypothetical protein
MGGWSVVAQASSAPPPANPWAVVSHAPVPGEVQAQRDADARGKDTPVADQGFVRSAFDTAKQLYDAVHDSVKKGDLGADAASQMLGGIADKLNEWVSGGGDLRKLPQLALDVSGAQAAGDRMQQQYDAGNYRGMGGSALGFVLPFVAHTAVAPAVDAAKTAASTVSDAADAMNGSKAANVAKVIVKHYIGGKFRLAQDVIDAATDAGDTSKDPIGVLPRRPASSAPAPKPAAAAPSAEAAAQAIEVPQTYGARPEAIPSQYGVLPALDRSQFFRPLPGDAPVTPAAAAPAPAVEAIPESQAPPQIVPPQSAPVAVPAAAAPDPWAVVSHAPAPEPVAPQVATPAAAPEPAPAAAPQTPEITRAQRIEDAAHEQAARLQMQADDIIWSNRAAKADRFAAYMLKNKIEPTPENLATVARQLAEREVPSAETVDMIHDRMGYVADDGDALRSRIAESVAPETPRVEPRAPETPATPEVAEEAESDLAKQLRESIAANEAKKLAAAAPETPAPAKPPKPRAKRVRKIGDLGKLGDDKPK